VQAQYFRNAIHSLQIRVLALPPGRVPRSQNVFVSLSRLRSLRRPNRRRVAWNISI
jgi:hypothetical protein